METTVPRRPDHCRRAAGPAAGLWCAPRRRGGRGRRRRARRAARARGQRHGALRRARRGDRRARGALAAAELAPSTSVPGLFYGPHREAYFASRPAAAPPGSARLPRGRPPRRVRAQRQARRLRTRQPARARDRGRGGGTPIVLVAHSGWADAALAPRRSCRRASRATRCARVRAVPVRGHARREWARRQPRRPVMRDVVGTLLRQVFGGDPAALIDPRTRAAARCLGSTATPARATRPARVRRRRRAGAGGGAWLTPTRGRRRARGPPATRALVAARSTACRLSRSLRAAARRSPGARRRARDRRRARGARTARVPARRAAARPSSSRSTTPTTARSCSSRRSRRLARPLGGRPRRGRGRARARGRRAPRDGEPGAAPFPPFDPQALADFGYAPRIPGRRTATLTDGGPSGEAEL